MRNSNPGGVGEGGEAEVFEFEVQNISQTLPSPNLLVRHHFWGSIGTFFKNNFVQAASA